MIRVADFLVFFDAFGRPATLQVPAVVVYGHAQGVLGDARGGFAVILVFNPLTAVAAETFNLSRRGDRFEGRQREERLT